MHCEKNRYFYYTFQFSEEISAYRVSNYKNIIDQSIPKYICYYYLWLLSYILYRVNILYHILYRFTIDYIAIIICGYRHNYET